jgi:putative acetyltransferase
MSDIIIRHILPGDNRGIAAIIRNSLAEFGANKPGTVFYDDTTDHLYEVFQKEGSLYYVAERDGLLLGGAGIYPSPGLPDGVAELVKMYLRKEARGLGLGRKMIDICLAEAARLGYHTIYLETMPELKKAVSVYEKFGFEYLNRPMGNTGHFGCDVWMQKKISPANAGL